MNTYSFDVFDTCLCRLCGSPYNAIEIISKLIISILPPPPRSLSIQLIPAIF
ncbi:MAG: hypothetical protein IJU19_01710 [Bacteroidales bacterium]|nr:hypothetical protein [Bacteroidales bacterium]